MIDTERPESIIPVSGLVESGLNRLGRCIPFLDRHTHGTGRMARVKHRPVTRIQIMYWTEQRQCGDIDERIIRHGRSLSRRLWGRQRILEG
jgi:hypothetical protein